MIITDKRTYYQKTPALLAANRWLENKLNEVKNDHSLTPNERKLAIYRFSPIDINSIWVENAKPTANNNGNCLLCFGIRKRGYVVLDAVCKLVTFEDCINYFNIPIKLFDNYRQLVYYIKSNKVFGLYKVKTSNKYGLLDDTSLSHSLRYKNFITALNDVYFDTISSYEDKEITIDNPIVGSIALSHGSMIPTTLELYSYQDIINL